MKKISPSMIEAGVAALQRNPKMGEESLAAKVYSAMEAAHVREEASRVAAPHGYVHQPFPSWRYGPDGSAKVVDREEDTPEGWTSTPPTAEEIEAHRAASQSKAALKAALSAGGTKK